MNSPVNLLFQRRVFKNLLSKTLLILPIYFLCLGSNTVKGQTSSGVDCCEKRGGSIDKPTKLTFTYTGGGCSFNNINASEGKHLCINGTVVDGPQFIAVLAEGELIGGERIINEGDLVEIYVKSGGGNNFGNELQVQIGTQIVEIHTSCSDALVNGENYGALRLEAVNGENGVTCGIDPTIVTCEVTFTNEGSEVGLLWQYFGGNDWSATYTTIQPGATHTQTVAEGEIWEIWNQADDTRFAEFMINCNDNTNYTFTNGSSGGGNGDCCEKRGGSIDKPTKLIFTYIGGGCTFNSVNASEGKHLCINGTVVNGPQFIRVLAEGELIGGARTIEEGAIVEIYVKSGGGNNFGNELQVQIGSQVVEIHTSCSDALVSGENYGALRLEAVNGENGITCGVPPPPCTLTGGVIAGNQSGCISNGAFNPSMLTSIEAATFDGTCNSTPPSGGNCCEEHGDHNHLQKIALRYVGSSPTNITAYADKDGSTLLYSGTTQPEDIILLDASNISGSKYDDRFDSGAKVQVGSTTLELHSSCSKPIDAGMGISANGDLVTNPNPSNTNILFIVEGLSTPDGCTEGTLDNTPPPVNEEAISYQWQFQLSNGDWTDIVGANSVTYDPPATSQTIKYRRVATNCCGIAISNEVTILISTEAPTIENCAYRIQEGGDWLLGNCAPSICTGSRLELSVSPNNFSSYQWSGPNGFFGSGNTDGAILITNSLSVNQAGTYTVTVTDENGCTNTSSIDITTSTCLCDLSVEVIDKQYMENNTNNTNLHTFSFSVSINGNSNSNWIMYDIVNGNKNEIIDMGNYGQVLNLGPYPVNQEGVLFLFMDANNSKCLQNVGVNMSDCVYTGACHCGNKKNN